MGTIAADGSWNVTVVSGLADVGLTAADGSTNVIATAANTFGAYHKCGALNYTVSVSGADPRRGPKGDLYVCATPYTGGGQKVTVISGSL